VFSLLRDLAGSHARFRIFMRHHDEWYLVFRASEADRAAERLSGVDPCKIPYADFPEFLFPRPWVNRLRRTPTEGHAATHPGLPRNAEIIP
jgi:hypothetical protein